MDVQVNVANLLHFVSDHIKTQKMCVEEAHKDPFKLKFARGYVKTYRNKFQLERIFTCFFNTHFLRLNMIKNKT